MNYKKTLDSGAVLEVTMSPFGVGHRLLKVLMRELEGVNLTLGSMKDWKEMFEGEGLNTLKNVLSTLIASDALEEALFACMERATYNGVKITKDIFEDTNARGDYFIIAKEVAWFNLSPFFKNLRSLVPQAAASLTGTQRPGSQEKSPS